MIFPGIMSTKINISIQCEELKENNPSLFAICGWNTCNKKFYEFWKSAPLKEYHMWVSSLFSDVSILTYSD